MGTGDVRGNCWFDVDSIWVARRAIASPLSIRCTLLPSVFCISCFISGKCVQPSITVSMAVLLIIGVSSLSMSVSSIASPYFYPVQCIRNYF